MDWRRYVFLTVCLLKCWRLNLGFLNAKQAHTLITNPHVLPCMLHYTNMV